MPIRKVDRNFGEWYYSIESYLSALAKTEGAIYNVVVENENAKLTMSYSYAHKSFKTVMTTELKGKKLDKFLDKLPNYLRSHTYQDIEMEVSALGKSSSGEGIPFTIDMAPGYVKDKAPYKYNGENFVVQVFGWDYSSDNFDGYAKAKSKNAYENQLKVGEQAELLQFIVEKIPGPIKGVCINAEEMVEQQFKDFVRGMLNKDVTKVIKIKYHDGKKDALFKASIFREPNNVEVEITGKSAKHVSIAIEGVLDLMSIKLTKKDKVSFDEEYKAHTQHKSLRVVGGAIATPFVLAAHGIGAAKDAVKARLDEHRLNVQKREALEAEVYKSHNLRPNRNRKLSCVYMVEDRQLLRKEIDDKIKTAKAAETAEKTKSKSVS